MKVDKKWFPLMSPASYDNDLRIICFHNLGGSAVLYNGLKNMFFTGHVCAIELPGRGNRKNEELSLNWKNLVNDCVDAIIPLCQGDMPVVFLGHSMGSWLAFETLLEIQRREPSKKVKKSIRGLVVSTWFPPHLYKKNPLTPDLSNDKEQLLNWGMNSTILDSGLYNDVFKIVVEKDTKLCLSYTPSFLKKSDDKSIDIQEEDKLNIIKKLLVFHAKKDHFVDKSSVDEWSKVVGSNVNIEKMSIDGNHMYLQESSLLKKMAYKIGDEFDAPLW